VTLYPWQAAVLANPRDPRKINVVVCYVGGTGKSYLVSYLGVRGKAQQIPGTLEKADDVMQWCMSFPEAEYYFLDMPRAIPQVEIGKMYAALECIKSGYMYDKRHKGKQHYFQEIPEVWVFTNTPPNHKWLTNDRWAFWKIRDGELLPYEDINNKDE
jgi:hypothetical protein